MCHRCSPDSLYLPSMSYNPYHNNVTQHYSAYYYYLRSLAMYNHLSHLLVGALVAVVRPTACTVIPSSIVYKLHCYNITQHLFSYYCPLPYGTYYLATPWNLIMSLLFV